MTELALIFLVGLAGGLHCVNSGCALVNAMGAFTPGRNGLRRHLWFNAGRVGTYVGLGGLAGAAGGLLVAEPALGRVTPELLGPRLLPLLAGASMILVATRLYAGLPASHEQAAATLQRAVPGMLRSRGVMAPLGVGAFSGILPSPLVLAFLALAAYTAHPDHGMAIMLVFGLGTVPAALAVGLGGSGLAVWHRGARLAATFVLALGTVLLLRGALPVF
jgi:uncharacterized protein